MGVIMRIRMAALFAAAVLALAGTLAFAQAPFPPVTIKKLKDNIYVAEGGGGNSTVIIGQNGVIVVDAKNRPPDGKQLLDEIGKLTDKPVTTVILTHSDPDHSRGLGGFPPGLTIIAHENDKKEIEQDLAAGGRQSPPQEYLPNKIVTQPRESMTIEGVRMTLIHIAPAHTSGDLAVYLPEYKVVASGDLIGNGDPTLHLEKNGSSEGWIRFVSALVDLDADSFVRGHADVATKEQVRQVLANAQAKRARIADLVNQGKSLDEIKLSFGEPAKNPSRFPTFTETTYQELTRTSSEAVRESLPRIIH
jgi:glyoxylase-like metal-dependent hydrolase (beta-lactamase superfamily II)